MQAVIMAGGKGTRLRTLNSEIPKPMFPISGKPILEYQIESLKKSGIIDITLIVGYLGCQIKDYFGNGSRWNVHIDYITEDKPLGTAGALYYLKGKIKEDFVLVFGDLILDVDFRRFMRFHTDHKAVITLFGHPNAHPFDSDVIEVDQDDRVIGIMKKNEERDSYYHNFVNAGLYCASPKLLETISELDKLDLEKQVIAKQIELGNVFAYRSTEYVKDMGTPERLNAVSNDLRNGVVNARSLSNKQKAIFLDRDGTINELRGFLNKADEFELLDHAADGIRLINSSRYLAIVATNQPVLARGECSYEELDKIHRKMETELGIQGAYIDDLYFCPHHPDRGFDGEIPELKIDCDCRKPKIGMLTRAADKYNIDLSQSWYIGDTTTDIQTGINAGMRTMLVRTGEAGRDDKYPVRADYEAENLLEAVSLILRVSGGQTQC
jgi:mannose-1-phosphate guanylyltransferase/phosphomannomutase